MLVQNRDYSYRKSFGFSTKTEYPSRLSSLARDQSVLNPKVVRTYILRTIRFLPEHARGELSVKFG